MLLTAVSDKKKINIICSLIVYTIVNTQTIDIVATSNKINKCGNVFKS